MLGANDVRFSRLMDRREAPARKRMGIRSPDGVARHPLDSPPTPLLVCHPLFPPTTFVRFASALTESSPGGLLFGRSGGTSCSVRRFLCQIDQRSKSLIDGFIRRKHSCHIRAEKYKIGPFAILFKVLPTDPHAEVFPSILRTKFV